MGQKTVEAMQAEYGTRPEDVIACIGPSICASCFEVGEEVAEEFRKEFTGEENQSMLCKKPEPGKYLVDLWEANRNVLLDAGVKEKNIAVTNVCARCNPDLLFSHRIMGTQRGNLCAFLGLIE